MPKAVIASPFKVGGLAETDQRFRSTYRLHKTDEFSSVFAFRRTLRGRFFNLHYRPGSVDTARLGVVVAKKLVRHATTRNMIKRIVRELFRRERGILPAYDLIVRLHAPVSTATRAELNQDVRHLLERLQK